MKVYTIRPAGQPASWLVLDRHYQPVVPIGEFLRFQKNAGRSPNTIRSYAYHLRAWWAYLDHIKCDWQTVTLQIVSDFINWLRAQKPRRPNTINAIVTAVYSFYQYHHLNQASQEPLLGGLTPHVFLRGRANEKRQPLTLPVPKSKPATLTVAQVKALIAACSQRRDQFLLTLLYQTGMRIGQALGLRHQDLVSEEQLIRIVPRADNANGMRAKTRQEYAVHISPYLLTLYTDYLVAEYPDDLTSDYVFVTLCGHERGQALTYSAVVSLFRRLSRKTGIIAHPHLFRHTHVTELLQMGVEPRVVQERVGHKSLQTTLETYAHLSASDVKRELQRAQVL